MPSGWAIQREPELYVRGGADVLVPDLAGWDVSGRSWFWGFQDPEVIEPDWICKAVRYAGDYDDRTREVDGYARARRIRRLWLVQPDLGIVEAFLNVGGRWETEAVFEDRFGPGAAPFSDVGFDVRKLWWSPP